MTYTRTAVGGPHPAFGRPLPRGEVGSGGRRFSLPVARCRTARKSSGWKPDLQAAFGGPHRAVILSQRVRYLAFSCCAGKLCL